MARDEEMAKLRAELEIARDVLQRVISFGGDDAVLASWQNTHRHHVERPYIGCPFCRDQYFSRVEVERIVEAVMETPYWEEGVDTPQQLVALCVECKREGGSWPTRSS